MASEIALKMALIQDNYFELDSCIHGHHIYIRLTGEGRREIRMSDPYAVAFIKSGIIVGHIPCWISAPYNLLIQRGSAK